MSYFRRALFAPRASVLTIDTNPPPVFGRCGATAETLALEGTLSDLAKQAYALTSAEIELMWKTAALRMPTPRPFGLASKKRTQKLCNSLVSSFGLRSQWAIDSPGSCGGVGGCKRPQ